MHNENFIKLLMTTLLLIIVSGCEENNNPNTETNSTQAEFNDTATEKTFQELSGNIILDRTLTNDKIWLLDGSVRVQSGVTLTIEAGTTIVGKEGTAGILWILSDAKLIAKGTAQQPILFTSEQAIDGREEASYQWGGVVIIGNETRGNGLFHPHDFVNSTGTNGKSSGILQHIILNNTGVNPHQGGVDIDGLALLGVTSNTIIKNITINRAYGDGIEIWGGSVNLKSIKIDNTQEDAFDTDSGWTGTVDGLTITNAQHAGIEISDSWDNVGTYKNVNINIDSEDSEGGIYLKAGTNQTVGGVFENVKVTYNSARLGAITVGGNFNEANSSFNNVLLTGLNTTIVPKNENDTDATAKVQLLFESNDSNRIDNNY